ncbi:MAG: DUF4838 domain-containing protein [Planctomycetota bacterium]|nr:DUF4838 domain-containing protein [Planctomycetota bacterium]
MKSRPHLALWLAAVSAAITAETAPPQLQTPDLTPVTFLQPVSHPPVALVRDGQPLATVYVSELTPSANLTLLVNELVEVVTLSTGATLDVVKDPPPADRPAIIIGNGEESTKAGIDATKLPIEGFVVKTAPNRVFLVGSTRPLPPMEIRNLAGSPYANDGTAWAVADFLERFVGVRWYWPITTGGRSVLKQATLSIQPSHYSDQPVFRKREFYPWYGYTRGSWRSVWFDRDAPTLPDSLLPPGTEKIEMQPLLAGLRAGNSWPYIIKVHEPQSFSREPNRWAEHADMFQREADGAPNLRMLCYSSQKALDYILEGCEKTWDQGKSVSWVTTTCVTVSPGDYRVHCHCEPCARLFEPDRAPYGTGSKVMALFVKRMCEAVKKRWPDKKVLYLPYWNYTECQEEIVFPDNLEVQMCTMAFGLMRQTEPRAHMERSLRAWSKKVGGRITTWEYSHRLPEWTCAPVQYPHLVQDYYRANHEILAGSFLNGGMIGEWSTAATTDYCWMKVLWNPDVNIDFMLDTLCDRMFGKAATACRELLRLECVRWEKAKWSEGLGDAGRVSPAVFTDTYPPEVVAKMIELRDRARREMAGDAVSEKRFAYWTWTFDAFLKEAKDAWSKAVRK